MDELATHVLIYYVRGIASHIKFNLGYSATKGVTAYQIYTTFWKAVSILELTCELTVIAAVSDGAPINRTLKTSTKLDINHIELNSYSIMNISLAV